jgi:hypothetical protein
LANNFFTGFKAVLKRIHCLHDRIALHELAGLHDEFGHTLCRCGTCAARAPIHIQVGAQTYADYQRTEYQFALIADQERLLDESDLCPHGNLFFLDILKSLGATFREPYE